MKNKRIYIYEGFEDFYDFYRDASEVLEPWSGDDDISKLDGEFQDTIKVTIEIIPHE